jgi:hypothetical protein
MHRSPDMPMPTHAHIAHASTCPAARPRPRTHSCPHLQCTNAPLPRALVTLSPILNVPTHAPFSCPLRPTCHTRCSACRVHFRTFFLFFLIVHAHLCDSSLNLHPQPTHQCPTPPVPRHLACMSRALLHVYLYSILQMKNSDRQ